MSRDVFCYKKASRVQYFRVADPNWLLLRNASQQSSSSPCISSKSSLGIPLSPLPSNLPPTLRYSLHFLQFRHFDTVYYFPILAVVPFSIGMLHSERSLPHRFTTVVIAVRPPLDGRSRVGTVVTACYLPPPAELNAAVLSWSLPSSFVRWLCLGLSNPSGCDVPAVVPVSLLLM